MKELDTIREMLRVSSAAQLLFDKGRLAALSPEAERLFPDARIDASAEDVFGEASECLERFDGKGSLLFPLEQGDLSCNVTLADCQGYVLATAVPAADALQRATLLSVAERIRHYMNGAMAASSQILPRLESDEEAMTRAAELNRGLYNLLRINQDLLAFGAPDSVMNLHPVRTDLSQWLAETMETLRPLCELAGRRLVFQDTADRCLGQVDRERMLDALEHLISNAVKFSEPNGEILLSLRRHGRRNVITVRDQGCGIPAGQMGQVFDRSEHRGPIPDPRWGVGLGLPLARRVVRAHGGSMMLESVEGEGTAVHIALPAGGGNTLILRSKATLPLAVSGYEPSLVGLADVLPSRAFDPRSVNL